MAFNSDTQLLTRMKKQPKDCGKDRILKNTKALPKFIEVMDEQLLMNENIRQLERQLDAQNELLYALDQGYVVKQCEHKECLTRNTWTPEKLDDRIVKEMIADRKAVTGATPKVSTKTTAPRGDSLRKDVATETHLSKKVATPPTKSFKKNAATQAQLLRIDVATGTEFSEEDVGNYVETSSQDDSDGDSEYSLCLEH